MKVYELLDSEDKWTQFSIARNKFNSKVSLESEEACKWCLLGQYLYVILWMKQEK